MRRILPILLLSAFLLGACAPTVVLFTREPEATPSPEATEIPRPPTETPIPSPTPVPDLGVSAEELRGLEVRVWHGWGGASAGLFAQMAEEFNQSNQWGIKVKVTAQSNLDALSTEVDKALGAPEQPDVVVALPEQILKWQESVVDLGPYLAQPEYGLDENEATGAFWEQSNVNGARYGVPAARSARFLFYNQSFARELGFDAPPLTAEDFRKQACAGNAFWKRDTDLTNDGYGGLALDVTSNWQSPYAWLAMGGGQVFADGAFGFNTPQNLKALALVSDLREAGCAWQPSSMSNFEHLASRRALFMTGSLGDIAAQQLAMSAAASADAWTVIAFPGEKPGIVGYGPDYAVLKSGGARQLAGWLFARWMLEPQNQVHWAHGSGLLPVTPGAAKVMEADNSLQVQRAAALRLIPQAVPYPQTAHWRLANKVLADGFYAYFEAFPNATLEGVLKTVDATVADLTK